MESQYENGIERYICAYWIHLAPDRYQWRARVNMVMNFSHPIEWWEFLAWLSNYWPLKKDSAASNNWTCGWRGTEDAESRAADKSGLMTEIWAWRMKALVWICNILSCNAHKRPHSGTDGEEMCWMVSWPIQVVSFLPTRQNGNCS
jgi:hypothetical protein